MKHDWIDVVQTIAAVVASLAAVGAAWGTVAGVRLALRQVRDERLARKRAEERERERQQLADEQKFEEQRFAQARLISGWPVGDDELSTYIAISNKSEEPVYRAIVSLVVLPSKPPSHPEYGPSNLRQGLWKALQIIPPGISYVAVASGWAGMHKVPGVEISFKDRAGVHWMRFADGGLMERQQPAPEEYGLAEPLGWGFPSPTPPGGAPLG